MIFFPEKFSHTHAKNREYSANNLWRITDNVNQRSKLGLIHPLLLLLIRGPMKEAENTLRAPIGKMSQFAAFVAGYVIRPSDGPVVIVVAVSAISLISFS